VVVNVGGAPTVAQDGLGRFGSGGSGGSGAEPMGSALAEVTPISAGRRLRVRDVAALVMGDPGGRVGAPGAWVAGADPAAGARRVGR